MKKHKKKDHTGLFDDLIPKIPIIIKSNVPEPREVLRQIVMFWRKEKCMRCKKTYEASHYSSLPMLQLELQKPIVHFGKMYGWRYAGTIFRPVENVSLYDHLPHRVENIYVELRRCPGCLHRPNVIYLEDKKNVS